MAPSNRGGGAAGPTDGRIYYPANPGIIGTGVAFSVALKLAVADYIELVCYQNSGGALNSSAVPTEGVPLFSASWIALG
jgi:hypothetical protein